MIEYLSLAANAATALGILAAVVQLWFSFRQQVIQFEDSLYREYRQIIAQIPTLALLGENLPDAEQSEALDEFYHYIDLSNEQVFLRSRHRVSHKTWIMWRDGIRCNLRRPAFASAWNQIKLRSDDDFKELRWLEESGFKTDPIHYREPISGP